MLRFDAATCATDAAAFAARRLLFRIAALRRC